MTKIIIVVKKAALTKKYYCWNLGCTRHMYSQRMPHAVNLVANYNIQCRMHAGYTNLQA